MKITVAAHELTDAQMQKVSLVKHGANRTPFKILKADAPEGPMDTDNSLRARLAKMFSANSPSDAGAKVVAVLVKAERFATLRPALEANGFRVAKEHAELLGDTLILKQDGYVDADSVGSMVALGDDLAVGYDRVVKEFIGGWSRGTSFDENMANMAFYPGFYLAMDGLSETIYQIMYDSHTADEASAMVETACKAFTKYVTGLARMLPVNVFKLEQDQLKPEFGASTVLASGAAVATDASITKGDTMNTKGNLREVVKGDLDGLFDEQAATVDKTEAGATGAEATGTEAGATADADAAAAAAPAAPAVPEATAEAGADGAAAAAGVEKTGEPSMADVLKGIVNLTNTVAELAKGQTTITERLNAVEKSATGAATVAKAAAESIGATVVMKDAGNFDQSFATLSSHRQVTKQDAPAGESGKDVWEGVLPGLHL